MERSKLRSSRAQLMFVVVLISTLAGANCFILVDNQSSEYFEVLEVTTAQESLALPPGYQVTIELSPPVNVTAAPLPEFLTFFQYTTPPNSTTNTTGVKQEYLNLYMYDNATVTLIEKNTTVGKIGFWLSYPASS